MQLKQNVFSIKLGHIKNYKMPNPGGVSMKHREIKIGSLLRKHFNILY
jgi:hypothetical protein